MIQGFSDASWGTRSQEGHLVKVDDTIVEIRSVLQQSVAQSTTEAEFKAANSAARDLLFVKKVFTELKFKVKESVLFCDNLPAVKYAHVGGSGRPLRHLNRAYQFLVSEVAKGSFAIKHLKGSEQLADFLTKPLGKPAFIAARASVMATF